MRRRDLIPLLGAALAARPLALRAQQPKMPVVGFLSSSDPERDEPYLAAWRKSLAEAGFVEGRTLAVEYRMVQSDPGRFPALAADLVARRVDVIMTTSNPAAAAAKAATTTIPIVFGGVVDPVGRGLVKSLNRPGGNVTGIAGSFEGLVEKRLQLLHELVPAAARIAYLTEVEPKNMTTAARSALEAIVAAGKTLGVEVVVLTAVSIEEIEPAFAAAKRAGVGAVVVAPGPFFYAQQKRLVELLVRYGLPGARHYDFAAHGGLLSYGPDLADIGYQGGIYVGRILKGAKPADLPVMQPTKFTLVINLKTAQALGLSVPPALLARADEVIE